MARDQYEQQDPARQFPGPEELGCQEQPHPGSTARTDPVPDHGERSYRGRGRLRDRAAVITGGDSGIGRAVAIAFAREGADVLLTHLPEEQDEAEATAALVAEAGRTAVTVAGDLRDEDHCAHVIRRAADAFGRIDILVNNAAYQQAVDGGIEDISTEQFDRVVRTNLHAMFWLCRGAVAHMRAGSVIINTSSIQAYQPSPELMDHATAKGAIVTFTKALSAGLADRGIRVNSVAPGPIWTPLIPATMPAGKVDSFSAGTPLGRAGQPAEVAQLYVFLASQESGYVTGEVVGITGGQFLG
ncbi:MAG TPA: glucose 1-dehydrogenase [Pseudonocardiaceae bacterium]